MSQQTSSKIKIVIKLMILDSLVWRLDLKTLMKVNLKKVMSWKINYNKLMKSFYQIVEMRDNCPKILFKCRDSNMEREPNRTNKKTLL